MVGIEKEVGGKNEVGKRYESNSRWHEYLMNEHIMGFKGRWKILGWVIHALWEDHYDMTIII